MLRMAPLLFTALRLRASQATRLLAAPIHWGRGCVRPRTHRRPATRLPYLRRRSFRPGLESLEEREMLDANSLLSNTYTTPGSYTWTAPLTGTVTVQLWGGGGGGAGGDSDPSYAAGGGGGGGGGFLRYTTSVVAGNDYKVVVGSGGAGGAEVSSGTSSGYASGGGNSYFISASNGEAEGGMPGFGAGYGQGWGSINAPYYFYCVPRADHS